MVDEILSPIIEYKISGLEYLLINIFVRLLLFSLAFIIIYFILYDSCLYNSCNSIVIIFFSILSLAFLEGAGVPISWIIDGIIKVLNK